MLRRTATPRNISKICAARGSSRAPLPPPPAWRRGEASRSVPDEPERGRFHFSTGIRGPGSDPRPAMPRPKLGNAFPSLTREQVKLTCRRPSLGSALPSVGNPRPRLGNAFPSLTREQAKLACRRPSLGSALPSVGNPRPRLGNAYPSVPREQGKLARRRPSLGSALPSVGNPRPGLGNAFPSVPRSRARSLSTRVRHPVSGFTEQPGRSRPPARAC